MPSGSLGLNLVDADQCRAFVAEVDLDEAFVIEHAHDPACPRRITVVVLDAVAFGVAAQWGVVRVLVRRAGKAEPLAGQRPAPRIEGRRRRVLGDPVRQFQLTLELVVLVVGDAVAEVALVLLLEHALERSWVHEVSLVQGVPWGSAHFVFLWTWLPAAFGRPAPSGAGKRPGAASGAAEPRTASRSRCCGRTSSTSGTCRCGP